jgi:DNA-directed RNA polymerase specialized sigma24 family protein
MNGDDLMAHWPLLVNYVQKRMRGADRAFCEDVAAQTIEKALTHYRDIGNPDGLRRWLMTVAGNAVLDYRASKRATEQRLLCADFMYGRLDAGSERHLTAIDVRAALSHVPDHIRDTAERYAEGHSLAGVADLTGLSRHGQWHRMQRAVERMRPLLEVAS